MKVNQLIDRIQKDWKVILFCFAVSVVTYVFHQTSLIEKRSYVIPVNVVENGDFMVNSNATSKVTVSVKANAENISAIHGSQLYAYVDLNSITEAGDYVLPVQLSIDDELLAFDPLEITTKPESIKVHVDRVEVRYIPVEPVIVGEPAHGYELKNYKVEPGFVRISGPAPVVEAVNSIITDKVLIQDFKRSSEVKVKCDQINKLITIQDEGPYTVSVDIDYVDGEMDFLEVPVNTKNLNEKLTVKSTIPSVGMRLAGHILSLENFKNFDNLASIDFSEVKEPGSYELDITFTVPSAYSIVQTTLEKIMVIVENVPVEEPVELPAEKMETASEVLE